MFSEDSDNGCRDRLSELPDSLIHAILSFLEMRDVAATTILSKRWKNLWTAVPCLRFSDRSENLDKFRSFVCSALALWKGPKILKLHIDFLFHATITHDLDSWLLFAIERQVEDLCINLRDSQFWLPTPEREYYAPEVLLSCQSITKLSLICCSLKVSESVKWNLLKSLTIESISSLSEDAMNCVLSGTPQLEVLNLRHMEGLSSLNIRSSSLKMLKIERYLAGLSYDDARDTMLKIWAPNLETLDFTGASYGGCLLSVPSLATAVVNFRERNCGSEGLTPRDQMVEEVMLSVSHVEKVTLSIWSTKVYLEMEDDVIVPFSNAKYLKLQASAGSEMLGILEFFPMVTILIVELEYLMNLFSNAMMRGIIDEEHYLVRIGAEARSISPSPLLLHLRTIEITWHELDASIFPAIKLMLREARFLEKLVFRTKWDERIQNLLCLAEEKLMSMRRSSPTAEVIVIKDSD